MKIYLDVLITVNFILTLIYLQTTAKLTHRRVRGRRLGAASLMGGLLSLVMVLDGGTFAAAVTVTVIKWVGTAMVLLTAFEFRGVWDYLRCLLIHIAIRAAYMGMIIVYWQLSDSKIIYLKNYTAYFNIPLVKLALAVICAYALLSLYEAIMRRVHNKSLSFKAVYQNGDNKFVLPAVSDSGNRLCDGFSGLPVVVFCCSEMYYHYGLDDFERGAKNGFRLTPYTTVADSGLMAVTNKGRVTITDNEGRSTEVKCIVGITRSDNTQSYAIFNPTLL